MPTSTGDPVEFDYFRAGEVFGGLRGKSQVAEFDYFRAAEVDTTLAVDATPPVSIYVSESVTKVSPVTGHTTTIVTWNVNEDCQAWQIREVAATTTPIASAGLLVKSGGSVPANTDQTTSITYADLSSGDGAKLLKIFTQDLAGNWST